MKRNTFKGSLSSPRLLLLLLREPSQQELRRNGVSPLSRRLFLLLHVKSLISFWSKAKSKRRAWRISSTTSSEDVKSWYAEEKEQAHRKERKKERKGAGVMEEEEECYEGDGGVAGLSHEIFFFISHAMRRRETCAAFTFRSLSPSLARLSFFPLFSSPCLVI